MSSFMVKVQSERMPTDASAVVLEGSMARAWWVGASRDYQKLPHKLIHDGILVLNASHAVFSKAYVFKSPSAAAAVIPGDPPTVV